MIFLLIEFFDELHYGIGNAVLPAIRTELVLSYAQIGLLLGLPGIINTLIEPVILLLGDTRLRKRLIVSGGMVILLALLLTASAHSLPALLVAFIIAYPASGAFVTLSQATLMDANPKREPHMMARWTLAGSLANLIGPLIVSAGFSLALGWRWVFLALAVLALLLVVMVGSRQLPAHRHTGTEVDRDPVTGVFANHPQELQEGVSTALRRLWGNLVQALHNRRLLRWIVLLQLSDLLLDILTGYVPLYLTDVIGVTSTQLGVLLSLLMLSSLVSDVVLIPLLERVPGRSVVRGSAAMTILVYAGLLLAPWAGVKIALLILVRFTTLGWYPVLQGEAYAAVPGQSGTVSAITSASGILGGGLAWLVGFIASQAGLPAAMWLLMLGPLSLALFVPRARK